jgi:ubiquinone/menaquinone biosynthesis C-methylase UbiE
MNTKGSDYIISGGEEGKKRLNVLSEVLSIHTKALLETDGNISGIRMLDLGCGGGNVALMAAQMVGEKGHVTAIDFDSEIISLAQQDAVANGIENVSFQAQSAYDIAFDDTFDISYSRFLLSHLQQPLQVLKHMIRATKAGGKIIVEDVQFSGHFCYPACDAFDTYLQYYTTAAINNGHNPEMGPMLAGLFHEAGIEHIKLDVIQPAFHKGPGKWMGYITLEKIKPMLLKQGLADEETINNTLAGLEAFTQNEQSIISLPRIFRVVGYKS